MNWPLIGTAAFVVLLVAYCLFTMSQRSGGDQEPDAKPGLLAYLVAMEKRIMSKLDDLAAAITDLGNTLTTEFAAVDQAIAAIGGSSTDPQVQALIDAVATLKSNVNAETTKVNNALTPPTP